MPSIRNRAFITSPQLTIKGNAISQIETILTLIAQKHLGIETLQTRNSDRLDFHDTAVWCIRDALEAAFKAGAELGASIPKPTESEIANT